MWAQPKYTPIQSEMSDPEGLTPGRKAMLMEKQNTIRSAADYIVEPLDVSAVNRRADRALYTERQ